MSKSCKNCGKEIDDDSNFCKYCGADLIKNNSDDKQIQECYECGYAIIGNHKFCSKCGTKIKK